MHQNLGIDCAQQSRFDHTHTHTHTHIHVCKQSRFGRTELFILRSYIWWSNWDREDSFRTDLSQTGNLVFIVSLESYFWWSNRDVHNNVCIFGRCWWYRLVSPLGTTRMHIAQNVCTQEQHAWMQMTTMASLSVCPPSFANCDSLSLFLFLSLSLSIYIYMHTFSLSLSLSIYIYMYTLSLSLSFSVYIYMYIYVCIYIHTWTHR
jgi:hypothetical protein